MNEKAFVKLWESSEKVPLSTSLEQKEKKNLRLNTLKRPRGTVSLYLYHTFSKAAQPRAKRNLGLDFSFFISNCMEL